jgi:hypothetical protein
MEKSIIQRSFSRGPLEIPLTWYYFSKKQVFRRAKTPLNQAVAVFCAFATNMRWLFSENTGNTLYSFGKEWRIP